MSTHSPTLFLDYRGNGLHLVIKSGHEKTEEFIKHGGGLVFKEATEYSITFASPDYEVMGDEEIYSVTYIKDCCDQNKLLNLKPYRLNKQSKYPDTFDPTDVFLKYTTWKDALQGKSFERFNSDDSGSQSSCSSDETSCSLVTTTSGVMRRRDYQESERMKIINYIIENKAYNSVKGRELWQTMEAEEICPGRTWQSLREHFTKKILPRIDEFGLAENKLRKFKIQKVYSDSSDTNTSVSISKTKRRDFSISEKKNIINYIIQHKAYDFVKGRKFWQRMETKKICPGRTWQSLKEHYRKQIIPKIDSFGLSEVEAQRLKRMYLTQ